MEPSREEMDIRVAKVKRIFTEFDANTDGGLNKQEMSSLVVAVNPRVHFSDAQIDAILDEVFETYGDFIDGDKGLTFQGLLQTYDDGAGDVDRDFSALNLELIDSGSIDSVVSISDSATTVGQSTPPPPLPPLAGKRMNPSMPVSPSQDAVFEGTLKIVEDLDLLINRLKGKKMRDFDRVSELGWSSEISPSLDFNDKRVVWDELGKDYASFAKELGVLRGRLEESRSKEEKFDGHMAMGKMLYENHLFKDALVSFKRCCDHETMNCRPHFRAGNCLYILGRFKEGKEEFSVALRMAEAGGSECAQLLPQIHVNLGISLEAEGMVLSACEHYREAANLCPTHFRALKLLGSAMFGVGEYRVAENVLEETIFLKPDYSDAHCDLGSALHALGEDERAIQEFQKAIDLKPGHVDALYNLGGLYMDMGRYQRASDMYSRVLVIQPHHWQAQLNKAVALLGAGEDAEAKKVLKEAFKMTKRVELHDAIGHLKKLQRKQRKGNGGGDADEGVLVVDPSKFKRINPETASREDLANALEIRAFQKLTRFCYTNVDLLKKEMTEKKASISYISHEKYRMKAALEGILQRLLYFLRPETFQGSVKAINKRILSVLDCSNRDEFELGMFYAILAPICSGPLEKRKQIVYNALQWQQGDALVKRVDALRCIQLLRTIYIPNSEVVEVDEEVEDESTIYFSEFAELLDDIDRGFGIMATLVKLENRDRTRHCHHMCSVCRYPINGSRFKELKAHFSLCGQCYSDGKVPSAFKQEEYTFKEYGSETEAMKDKCRFLRLHTWS